MDHSIKILDHCETADETEEILNKCGAQEPTVPEKADEEMVHSVIENVTSSTEDVDHNSVLIPRSDETKVAEETVSQMLEKPFGPIQIMMDVSTELQDITPNGLKDSHAFRNEIIREARDLSTKEKLEATYRNDDYEVKRTAEMAKIANGIRDNKAMNFIREYGTIAVCVTSVGAVILVPPLREIVVTKIPHIGRWLIGRVRQN